MKKINKFVFSCSLLMMLVCFSTTVFGNETTSPFSVGTTFSEHQTNKSDSFFDILFSPGQMDKIGIRITNHTPQEQTYLIKTGKARTVSTGTINYTDPRPETEAEKYKISELLKLSSEVKVPANSHQIVEGTITFPNDPQYNGILIGGINVSQKEEDKNSSNEMITNKISYTIPLVIRGNIDKRPDPEIKFDKLDIKQLTSDSYSVNVEISNEKATLLNDAKFEAIVSDDKGKIIDTQKSALDITPETKFEYPVKLGGNYSPGKYMVAIKIDHENHHWTGEKSFSVSDKKAKAIKAIKPKKSFFKEHRNLVYLLVVGVVMTISTIVVLIIRRKV